MLLPKRITTLLIILVSTPILACTGGTNSGTITPTTSYQTLSISNGQYYTLNVSCGNTYNFSFCSNGGTASWDTQLTLLNSTGTVEIIDNDDFCGLQSDLTWTADFTGTVQILISQYSCNHDGTSSGTLAYNMTVGTPNSSFTLNSICGGATATVTGDSGGTFSWNPSDPGDGSVLNTSTGQITGGVSGATYTLDYTVCSSSSTQSVTLPTGDCWTLNGDATYTTINGEQCIQLTGEINNQTGCAWNGSQIDFASPFTLSLDYYFGNNVLGADGSTFTFQPSSSTACGTPGGQLGAGGLNNALTIEFDTYDNDNPAHIYDMLCDHIAVEIDGNLQGPGAPLCGPVCAKASGGNIDDGGTYAVDITWNPATLQLEIYFDGVLRLSCTHDFITNVFGTNSVYWGVTSATGGLNNQQYFCPSTVILPTEMASFNSECEGNLEKVSWSTLSEINVSHFTLEATADGILYEPIQTIKATGNSQELREYEVRVPSASNETKLYRLKMVDNDGEYDYSSLILSKGCGQPESIIGSMSTIDGTTHVTLNDRATCTLYNSIGQIVFHQDSTQGQLVIDSNQLKSGIYLLRATNLSGETETIKLFID